MKFHRILLLAALFTGNQALKHQQIDQESLQTPVTYTKHANPLDSRVQQPTNNIKKLDVQTAVSFQTKDSLLRRRNTSSTKPKKESLTKQTSETSSQLSQLSKKILAGPFPAKPTREQPRSDGSIKSIISPLDTVPDIGAQQYNALQKPGRLAISNGKTSITKHAIPKSIDKLPQRFGKLPLSNGKTDLPNLKQLDGNTSLASRKGPRQTKRIKEEQNKLTKQSKSKACKLIKRGDPIKFAQVSCDLQDSDDWLDIQDLDPNKEGSRTQDLKSENFRYESELRRQHKAVRILNQAAHNPAQAVAAITDAGGNLATGLAATVLTKHPQAVVAGSLFATKSLVENGRKMDQEAMDNAKAVDEGKAWGPSLKKFQRGRRLQQGVDKTSSLVKNTYTTSKTALSKSCDFVTGVCKTGHESVKSVYNKLTSKPDVPQIELPQLDPEQEPLLEPQRSNSATSIEPPSVLHNQVNAEKRRICRSKAFVFTKYCVGTASAAATLLVSPTPNPLLLPRDGFKSWYL